MIMMFDAKQKKQTETVYKKKVDIREMRDLIVCYIKQSEIASRKGMRMNGTRCPVGNALRRAGSWRAHHFEYLQ